MESELNKNNYDLQLKIILVGDSGVGKSSILSYYLKNTCKFYKYKFNMYDLKLKSTTILSIQ